MNQRARNLLLWHEQELGSLLKRMLEDGDHNAIERTRARLTEIREALDKPVEIR